MAYSRAAGSGSRIMIMAGKGEPDAASWKQNEAAFERYVLYLIIPCCLLMILMYPSKDYSKYYDPCQEAASRSIRCLHRNTGNKELCSDFFQYVRYSPTIGFWMN